MTELGWRAAHANRERGNHSCNALVVLDDGQRWIPQDAGRDDDNFGRLIQDHVRKTRKYGLGWMIVAQTGIHNEVLPQQHTTHFGRGLRIGADQKHLEQNLGSDGHEAYKQIELQGSVFWVATGTTTTSAPRVPSSRSIRSVMTPRPRSSLPIAISSPADSSATDTTAAQGKPGAAFAHVATLAIALRSAHTAGAGDPHLRTADLGRGSDVKASLLRTAMILNGTSAARWARSCNIDANSAKPGNCLDNRYGTRNAFASDVEGAAVRD